MSKVFTPQDANEILPEVKRRFNKIISQKNHVVSLQEELQKIVESGLIFDPFIKKKQELNSAVLALYGDIEGLEAMGVLIKSVDEGLVDFPSRRFDDEVWLCWKSGETEIKFWHAKDEGFIGRKPLSPKGFLDEDLEDLR